MEIKDRFTCTQCSGSFSGWAIASKARALGAAENAPDPVWKNPGGKFWTKRNITNSWQLGTPKRVNCNRRACRIELADLGSNFPCAKSILLPALPQHMQILNNTAKFNFIFTKWLHARFAKLKQFPKRVNLEKARAFFVTTPRFEPKTSCS